MMSVLFYDKNIVLNSRAIVLGFSDAGESSRFVYLLGERCGHVLCMAQSIRQMNSKQRLHLKLFSLVHVSLVCGRTMRVRSSVEKLAVASYMINCGKSDNLAVLARLCRLVQKFAPLHDNDLRLYDTLYFFIVYLLKSDREYLKEIELLAVLWILSDLGYIEENDITENLLSALHFDEPRALFIREHKVCITQLVNNAIRASGL
jgi:recombinational DNA repair protein (RecF pathway)